MTFRMRRRFWSTIAIAVVAANAPAQTVTAKTAAPVQQRAVVVPSNDDLVARMIQEGTQRSHVDADRLQHLRQLLRQLRPRITRRGEIDGG